MSLSKNRYLLLAALIIFIGSVFQGVALFKTGGEYSLGNGYWGPLARDGMWHEALVGQIGKGIPPENPGFAGSTLTNYHYFYDTLVSFTANITGLASRTLIYLFFPFMFSVLLGQGVYLLALRLFKSKLTAIIALFFLYFGSSFGWVLGVLRSQEIGGESAFWANQPVSMNLNPPFAASLVVLVAILLLVDSYLKECKKYKSLAIIVLSGMLIGLKAYAGVIVLVALFVLGIKKYVVDKDLSYLMIFAASFGIAYGVYSATSSGAESLVIFQPLWLVDTMIDAGDRVGIPALSAKRFAYLAEHKWIHLVGVEAIALTIFMVGNLGTRLVALISIRRSWVRGDIHLFLGTLAVASFLPPLLFIQKGNPWNIIQFFYYFLFVAGLYSAYAVTRLLESKKLWVKVAVVVLLVITPISSVATFRSWLYPNPPSYLPTKEAEALSYLAHETDGIVLIHPFDKSLRTSFTDPFPMFAYADTAYVSAYSGKSVYLEDIEQQIILDVDYKTRQESANRFFEEPDIAWSNEFLLENNIAYVYVPKVYMLPAAEASYKMKKLFENSEVNIYRVVK